MSEVSELEQERLQSAKLCNDNALLRDLWCRIQQDYQNLKNDHTTLQSKLAEMEQVLAWASERVWRIEPNRKDIGGWFCITSPNVSYSAPTLYAALHSAWEARER